MASGGMSTEEYWKDDFRPLSDASKAIQSVLEADEKSTESDLYRRLLGKGYSSPRLWSTTEPYSHEHAYHNNLDDPHPVTLTVQHTSSRPLPDVVMQAKKKVVKGSFMGVLPALGWGYMTVDKTIFLFSLNSDSTNGPETLLSFTNPGKEIIMSAQLVKPRPGIFKKVVEYCLVVTTIEDVRLLALAKDELGVWNCVPTSFVVSSDKIKFTAIAGTEDGRIFLGGDDGCLHEFLYENTSLVNRTLSVQEQLDSFYEGTKDIPSVISEQTGKRPWWQSVTSTSHSGEPPRKCRKLNRSASGSWPWTTNLSKLSDGVRQIVVDDERQTLSMITQKGFLQVYNLWDMSKLQKDISLPATTVEYLRRLEKNRGFSQVVGKHCAAMMNPDSGSTLRESIRHLTAKYSTGGPPRRELLPVKMSVISCRESSSLTLLVVTQGGIRLYLSTLSDAILRSGAVNAISYSSKPPLAPATVTLCQVRPPPDLNKRFPVSLPDFRSSSDLSVDASFYDRGHCLLAVQEKATPNKNVVLSATPDYAARPVPEQESNKPPEASTGLAETMTLPVDGNILNGGIVWDFCKLTNKENSSVSDLFWRSQTLKNADDLDIPPPYYPPSKVKRASDTSSDIRIRPPQPGATVRATAIHAMGQAFVNFMLSRSLSHGMGTPLLTNGPDHRQTNLNEALDFYRVSTRTGVHGFSTTAGEKGPSRKYSATRYTASTERNGTSSSSHKFTKSARLQHHLLRPMAVPLHHLATQHLEPKGTQVVAINANGVHTFTIESILSAFAKAILSAGELVTEDSVVTKFFTSYGYDEACAMGLALAVGCGPANGTMGQSQSLRGLSIRAVMARGLQPKLEKDESGVGLSQMSSDRLSGSVDSSLDPLVPPGHLFYDSKLYKGLRRLFGRLVRPIWNKPLVVVTEGRSVKSHWSHGSLTTPAKVEILLDDGTLSDIRAPLHSLLQLTKEVFKRAIDQVPGVVQRQDSTMDIDDGSSQRTPSLTQASHYRSSARTGISELSEKDRENLAHLIEEKNIHSLYRLLCRVVQLLNLLQLLRKAESMVELPQIDWGVLHGLTVCQLAKTPEGQDRIEKLLNSLVVASASSAASLSYSAQANKIAQEFAEKCYLFYPPASRFAYNGIRFAMEALASAPSNRRDDLIAQASSSLIDAATQWRSATLISGRLLRFRGTESHQELVARALQNGSPLAKAAELLVELGAVAEVVEICLVTSWNFQNRRPAGHFREAHLDGVFGWERDLYHKNRDSRQSSTVSTPGSPGTPESYGVSVSEKDAVDTCYAIIFYHLSTLLTSKSQLADQMLSACTSYTDKLFLDALFQFLYDRNRTDVLVRISSPDVEKWLQDRNLPDLLWRYYDIQGKKYQSAKVSCERAISEDVQLTIEERIECLTRASNSLQDAKQDTDIPSYDELTRFKTKVDDFLAAARIQHRILQAIESYSDITTEDMREKLAELKTSLLNISALYGIASSIPLTDLCLVIYHKCQHQDTQSISMLWTSLFGEKLLPMAASSNKALSFLRKLATDVRREQAVEELDESGMSHSGYRVFEEGEWISDLSNKIIIMGQELYGTGADYTFPVDFLLESLEKVRKACPNLHHPSWSLTILASARVPYLTLIESYKALSSREERYTSDTSGSVIKESLDAQVGLLAFWEASSSGGGDQSYLAKQELDRSRATGELQSYIDHLHNKISLTTGTDDLTSELKQVEEKLSYLLG